MPSVTATCYHVHKAPNFPRTRPFQRDYTVSPDNDGCHWNDNGETLFLIGDAMGKGLVKMLKH